MKGKKEVIEFQEEHPPQYESRIEHLKKKALNISITEGSASTASSGLGSSYTVFWPYIDRFKHVFVFAYL
jgi:molybdenum-dependent DNA-binding transcriptional regulator ModE